MISERIRVEIADKDLSFLRHHGGWSHMTYRPAAECLEEIVRDLLLRAISDTVREFNARDRHDTFKDEAEEHAARCEEVV